MANNNSEKLDIDGLMKNFLTLIKDKKKIFNNQFNKKFSNPNKRWKRKAKELLKRI